MFGMFGFPSFPFSDVKGGIPFPCPGEKSTWAHAIATVGYDDNIIITNTMSKQATTGALLIRNSWGTTCGMDGYYWLPYDFVRNQFAQDFWSLLQMDWLATGQFGFLFSAGN
jgi:C1A family cysteine protease